MGKGMEIAVVYRDEDVKRRVKEFFSRQHFPSLQLLDLKIEQGELTVRGEVCTFYEKQVAMSICQSVPGVLVYVDRIKVAAN